MGEELKDSNFGGHGLWVPFPAIIPDILAITVTYILHGRVTMRQTGSSNRVCRCGLFIEQMNGNECSEELWCGSQVSCVQVPGLPGTSCVSWAQHTTFWSWDFSFIRQEQSLTPGLLPRSSGLLWKSSQPDLGKLSNTARSYRNISPSLFHSPSPAIPQVYIVPKMQWFFKLKQAKNDFWGFFLFFFFSSSEMKRN